MPPKDMTPDQFSRWMDALNLTADQVSAELGISKRTIYRYRSGEWPVPKVVALACQWISQSKEEI